MSGHPSELTLERFSVGDLPPDVESATAQHVAGCLPCRRLVDELEAARAARLVAMPVDPFVARVAERHQGARSRRRWSWAAATSVAAAAAALLLLPRPQPKVRFKGGGVTVHRQRGGEARVLARGERVRAGDALRIVIARDQAGPVGAWIVDAHGRVDALLPGGIQTLPAGADPLPGSAVVESPCIDSWLVIATGSAAVDDTARALERAVAGGVPQGDGWIPRGTEARPLFCE